MQKRDISTGNLFFALLVIIASADYIHLLIEISPKYSVLEIMGYLKSKSTLIIFDRHTNMKYKFGNKH